MTDNVRKVVVESQTADKRQKTEPQWLLHVRASFPGYSFPSGFEKDYGKAVASIKANDGDPLLTFAFDAAGLADRAANGATDGAPTNVPLPTAAACRTALENYIVANKGAVKVAGIVYNFSSCEEAGACIEGMLVQFPWTMVLNPCPAARTASIGAVLMTTKVTGGKTDGLKLRCFG